MNLIHFQGLNCYHDCIISIVDHFGLKYSDCFATLWSETDFRYDPYHEVYLTKRMLANLEALGAKVESMACASEEDACRNLSRFCDDELMVVGMDAFYIPWSPFYRTFYGPHYFIAQNASTETLLCFDPTYGKKNEPLARRELVAHAYEFCRVSKVESAPLQIDPQQEATEIVRTHPDTRSELCSQIWGCVNGKQKNTVLLAKYIDTLIHNRDLYRVFLENQSLPHENHLFLNSDFFLEWKAVKNGLYKASISRSNVHIISDVCAHLNHLIDQELDMARRITSHGDVSSAM